MRSHTKIQIHSNDMGFADIAAMFYDSDVALSILISYHRLQIICTQFLSAGL
jgi:hypothetical protein